MEENQQSQNSEVTKPESQESTQESQSQENSQPEQSQETTEQPESTPEHETQEQPVPQEPSPEDVQKLEVNLDNPEEDITAELDALNEEVEEEAGKEIKKKNKRLVKFGELSKIARSKEESTEDKTEIKQLSKEMKQAKERMMEIRDKLMTMKWDVEHGQINPAKKLKYNNLKKEFDELEILLNSEEEQ